MPAPEAAPPEDAHAWQRAKRLLEACLDADVDVRRELLERAGADEPALRRRVESLLRAHDTGHALLDDFPAVFDDPDALGEPIPHHAGGARRIGGYRLGRVLGEGGMGIVYEAFQERPGRRVALKVLRPSVVSERAVERFRFEVEVLGRLDHPGIARIYDSGLHVEADALAVPWFAMELVDGAPLVEHAAALELPARLDLFLELCDAVHAAHLRGVIHRDLKPANILVAVEPDGRARVKVLDFGVARASGADLQPAGTLTLPGLVLGTLPYMSPEQLDGDPGDVDLRSDVYALGVLLYELLVGRLPLDVAGESLTGAARRVQEEQPAPPSRHDRAFRGDVDTIVGRALAKRSHERYASVAELAEDLRRMRRHEPILARPPSLGYLLARFARRHRALTAATLLAVAALLTALVVVSDSLEQSRAAERRTAAERDKASAALAFLQDMLTAASPFRDGHDVQMSAVLDRAVAALDDERPPEVDAILRRALGDTYVQLGRFPAGLTQLERAADTLEAELGVDAPAALEARATWALECAAWRADVLAGFDAPALVARSRAALGDADPTTLRARVVAARVLDDASARAPALRAVLDDQRAALGAAHPDSLRSADLLARQLGVDRRHEDVRALLTETLDARTRTLGPDHGRTLTTRRALAVALDRLGRPAEAEAHYRAVVERLAAAFGPTHRQTVTAEEGLAQHLYWRGQLDAAEAVLAPGLARADFPVEFRPQRLNTLGVIHAAQGRLDEAEDCARRSLEATRAVHGDEHVATLTARDNWASALDQLGRHAEALAVYRETLPAWRARYADDPVQLVGPLNMLGNVLSRTGSWDEAAPHYEEGAELARAGLPEAHTLRAIAVSGWGTCLAQLARHADAERVLLEAEALWRAQPAAYRPRAEAVLGQLIGVYVAWGRPELEAEARERLAALRGG